MIGTLNWPMHTLSPAMQAVYDRAATAAPTNASILIQGEAGVGKQVIARRIHVDGPSPQLARRWLLQR